MPDWLSIVLLGIIEGITEFLPISSTGHLLIAQRWLPRQSDLFNILIQTAAVMAVLPLFRGRILSFLTKGREPATRDYLFKVGLAFFITGVLGFFLDKSGLQLPEKPGPVGWALLIGGVLFLVVEYVVRDKKLGEDITWTIAIAVGLGQVLAAVFPGASRSGTTILAMLCLGLSRPAATEFTFLVSIPTMMAAGGVKLLKAVRHLDASAAPEHWGHLALGCVVSAIVSFIAVKWLLRFVQSHTFNGFGWYRIVLGAIILLWVGD
ncbi:MAG: undecaprenyl-diphosphate phosphatase [Verrucomicrobia bacterium]|nr:undecaprenyl-diphosphate phosphatase [Verrucomicrobiota bacterium]